MSPNEGVDYKQEGAAFIVIESWISNKKYPEFPEKKFVGLTSEMDKVVDKFEASGGDWRILRDELSLGENVDLSRDKISYIRVSPDDKRFSFDMPSGREAGAYDGEWVTGGFTKGGTTEATLRGSEKIRHNNNLNDLES